MSDTPFPIDSAVHALKLDADDGTAWTKLVYRYQGRISGWCLRYGLQLVDAENVLQEVLVLLTRKIHLYDPAKGEFPAWLHRVTLRVCADYARRQAKLTAGTGDTAQMQRLQEVEDDAEGFWEEIERESDRKMLAKALGRARKRVTAQSWEIFTQVATRGVPGPAVADQFKVPVQTVYMARYRVLKILREEVERLRAAE